MNATQAIVLRTSIAPWWCTARGYACEKEGVLAYVARLPSIRSGWCGACAHARDHVCIVVVVQVVVSSSRSSSWCAAPATDRSLK